MITSGVSLRSLTCSVATPVNIDYYSSLGVLLEYVIIFAGEKSGLGL
jgi:hypothetical protein